MSILRSKKYKNINKAIEAGITDKKTLKNLLEEGATCDEETFNTALENGIGDIDTLLILNKSGALVNKSTLAIACYYTFNKNLDKSVLKMLINSGIKCNKTDLNEALEAGIYDIETLKMLIKAGARGDKETLSIILDLFVDRPVIENHYETIKLLFDAGARCIYGGVRWDNTLHNAICYGIHDKKTLQMLIDNGARGGGNIIHYALENAIEDRDLLRLLIKNSDFSIDEETIDEMLEYPMIEMFLDCIIEKGARCNKDTLNFAIDLGIKDKEIFKMLIKAGASGDKETLKRAIKAGIKDKDVLKMLIDNGAGGTEETFDKVLKIINKRSSPPKRRSPSKRQSQTKRSLSPKRQSQSQSQTKRSRI